MSGGTKTLVHLDTAQADSIDAWSAFLEHVPARDMWHQLVAVSDRVPALKAPIKRYLSRSEIIPRHRDERSAIKLICSMLIRADRRRRLASTVLERSRRRTRCSTMCRNQPDSKTSSFRIAA